MRTKFPPNTLRKKHVLFTFTSKNNDIKKKSYFIKNQQLANIKSFAYFTSLQRKANPFAGNNHEQYNRSYLYAAHPASSLNIASPAPQYAGSCPTSDPCYCSWCENCCYETEFSGCPGNQLLCGCGNEYECGPC